MLPAAHCTYRAEPNAHPSLVPTMCALSAGAFALVAGDQIELKPMKLLIAAVGHDVALRPLPLAAGARSNPAAFTITLSRLVEPSARVLRPASSSARSPARTGDDRANELASCRRRYGRSPRASRTAALWRSWRHPVRLARCMRLSGPAVGLGPPGQLAGDRL